MAGTACCAGCYRPASTLDNFRLSLSAVISDAARAGAVAACISTAAT